MIKKVIPMVGSSLMLYGIICYFPIPLMVITFTLMTIAVAIELDLC